MRWHGRGFGEFCWQFLDWDGGGGGGIDFAHF